MIEKSWLSEIKYGTDFLRVYLNIFGKDNKAKEFCF